jgi:hypothetical protein
VRARVPFRIPASLHEEIRLIALALGVSINECGNHALARWVKAIYQERPELRAQVRALREHAASPRPS